MEIKGKIYRWIKNGRERESEIDLRERERDSPTKIDNNWSRAVGLE